MKYESAHQMSPCRYRLWAIARGSLLKTSWRLQGKSYGREEFGVSFAMSEDTGKARGTGGSSETQKRADKI